MKRESFTYVAPPVDEEADARRTVEGESAVPEDNGAAGDVEEVEVEGVVGVWDLEVVKAGRMGAGSIVDLESDNRGCSFSGGIL